MASFEDLTTKVNKKSTELDGLLVDLKKENDRLRLSSGRVLEMLKKLVGSFPIPGAATCSVCYSRPREYVLLPCGHAGLCENCATRAQGCWRNRSYSFGFAAVFFPIFLNKCREKIANDRWSGAASSSAPAGGSPETTCSGTRRGRS